MLLRAERVISTTRVTHFKAGIV